MGPGESGPQEASMSSRRITWAVLSLLGCAASAASAPAASPTAARVPTRVVRLPAREFSRAKSLALRPARQIDYGSFAWIELSEAEFAKLQSSGVSFEEQRDAFVLRLGEQSFDPLVRRPVLAPGWDAAPERGADLHLVQFAGPARPEWRGNLEASGLKVVEYIEPMTYVVWGEGSQLQNAAARSEVRWSGAFSPGFRVLPRWQALGGGAVDVQVMVYRGSDVDAAIREIGALGGKLGGRSKSDASFEIVSFQIAGSALKQAAAVRGVYSIQPEPKDGGLRGEMSDQVNVNNVDGSNQAFPGYLAWLTTSGVNGSGVVIANVDGGVQDTHPNLVNRMLPCIGSTCGGATSSSHGTHTAGIMAADGTSGVLDSLGFLRGLGVAPGAKLIEQLYNPTFTQPGGMLLLMTQSYQNGASLSGNSWGPAGTPRGYDSDTRQVDVGVRDADPNAAGNQPLSFVLSFMNGNGGTSSQGTPDEGKNIFTIGSTKLQNSGSGSQILQINDLSSNSAHGPALDGRTIPHMVAPGCYIDSTVPTNSYGLNCGTSMASPHVSGAVALFIQYFRGLPDYSADPSPALVKAAFLAVARNLAGNLDADGGLLGNPFDSKQGWGRMDLAAVVDPSVPVSYFDNPTLFTSTGQEWVRNVAADDPSKPLRIMLVWTDAPGHGLGGSTPAWNNNLDLTVESGPNTYRGNVFDVAGWSQSGGSADSKNNTEGVFIGPTAPGSYTIRVTAANINSDGVPNNASPMDQDFAVACYNCALQPGFTVSATPGQQGVCEPDSAVYTVNVGQVTGFTNDVTLSVSGEPAGTTVGFSTNPVTPPGSSTLTIGNTAGAAPGTYILTVTGTSGVLVRQTTVRLDLFDGAPDSPVLTMPVDGATDVALLPSLAWNASANATSYDVQVATDAGFSNVISSGAGITGTNFTPAASLTPGNLYYWHVRGSNACGSGKYSAAFSFTARLTPKILLVDDDDNSPDVRSAYTSALVAIGQDYDVWDTNNTDNEPTAAQLAPYRTVIWFTGDEFGGFCGPGAAGEAALSAWLDTGRCLFLTSQDMLWDRGGTGHNVPTAFMQNYLGMANPGQSDVSQTSVTGAPGSIFAGMGPFSLSYPFTNFSDRISPNGSALLALTGSAGNAAVQKDSGVYRTTFWGFPLEAVSNPTDRAALMSVMVNWCADLYCPTRVGNMTAPIAVNGDDVRGFVGCYTGGSPAAPGCRCADMNQSAAFEVVDVELFVNCLLGLGCP